MTEKPPVVLYPLPGAIDDESWTMRAPQKGETPATDFKKHEMIVPLDDSEVSYSIRTHEQLHVAITPPEFQDMQKNDPALSAAEEARLETIATAYGIDRDYGLPPNMLRGLVSNPDMHNEAWLCATAAVGGPDEAVVRQSIISAMSWSALMKNSGEKSLARQLISFMDQVKEILAADTSFDATRKIADELRPHLKPKPPKGGTGQNGPVGGSAKDGLTAVAAGESSSQDTPLSFKESGACRVLGPPGEQAKRMPSQLTPGSPNGPKGNPGGWGPGSKSYRGGTRKKPHKVKMSGSGAPGNVLHITPEELYRYAPVYGEWTRPAWHQNSMSGDQWSPVDIVYPPLTRPVKVRGFKPRPADYGVVLKSMWRATSDEKVFTSRRHRPMGTVLVDLSGSMHLSNEAVEEIIRNAPAAVVAGYSGWGIRGSIRVLAAGGMMADRKHFSHGGGNDIDGVAVEWLARQRPPRVLVSDMQFVFGPGRQAAHRGMIAFDAALSRIENARIKVINTPDDAVAYMR